MNIFNPLTCPLSGSNLLEASAGTGKTYSIAFLYLRLIVQEKLEVKEILVTTFTKAAVSELKSRIYQQIITFEQLLRNSDLESLENTDELLVKLHKNTENKSQTIKRLQLAKAEFNYAKIQTIDGFSLQLLKDNYLSLNSYDVKDVVNNNQEIIKKIYINLASRNFKPCENINKEMIDLLAKKSVLDISKIINGVLEVWDNFKNAQPTIWDFDKKLKTKVKQLNLFIKDNKLEVLNFMNCLKKQNGKTYNENKTKTNLDKLENFLDNLENKPTLAILKYFTTQQIKEKFEEFNPTSELKKNFFEVWQYIYNSLNFLVKKEDEVFYNTMFCLATYMGKELPKYKSENLTLTYSDVTKIVSESNYSENNLKTDIKAALIDEAQDTNKQQITLFSSLFINTNKICFFVGDPKQAIYGFRGGDIFAYLEISKIVNNKYLLDTNYRSSKSLNNSVNYIFSKNRPFGKDISYENINSQKDNLCVTNNEKSLYLTSLEKGSTDEIAKQASQYIFNFINSEHKINSKPITEKDITILTRTNSQAQSMKKELAKLGISASFTGKKSVLETNEAMYFYYLLCAISNPEFREIKRLLISPLYKFSLIEIKNDDLVSKIITRFSNYQKLYDLRGFAYVFYQILLDENIANNLLSIFDGKRKLTNFFHVFDILLTECNNMSLYAVCDLLSNLISNSKTKETSKDAQQLRLDDKNAINIYTIHNSKGLEFNFVFHPFIDSNNTMQKSIIINSNQINKASFKGNSKEITSSYQFQEELETIRLAYVELTRAKYKNIIFIQNKKASKQKSMWDLLKENNPSLNNLGKQDFTKEIIIEDNDNKLSKKDIFNNFTPKKVTKTYSTKWNIQSFSSISSNLNNHNYALEPLKNDANLSKIKNALIEYPKGAEAGTSLHEMFEGFMESRVDFLNYMEKSIQKHLPNNKLINNEEYLAKLNDDLINITNVNLYPESFCLADIDVSQQSIEMEFIMHLSDQESFKKIKSYKKDTINKEGYLHGFIDLMFFYNGKFYILDYKSNFLGKNEDDYTKENMDKAMTEHNYYLQAEIYAKALQKFLKNTVENFDYDKIFGGAFYLFIRGMSKNSSKGIHFHKPKLI